MAWLSDWKLIIIGLFVVVAITVNGSVEAHGIPKDRMSYNSLPEYCAVRKGFGTDAQYKMWSERLSGGFNHLHHYCFALHQYEHLQKMFPMNKKEKSIERTYIKDALGNIRYMETHADGDFILMPEIMVLKGRVLEKADRRADAIVAYQRALNLKPDYVNAYTALSDVYKKLGDIAMAKQILEKGLEKRPNSKALKRRLKKLEK